MAPAKTSWNFKDRVVIAPCTGIGNTAGTISRQAAYEVVEKLLPDRTVLLCLPALNIDVEEDLEMVRQNPGRIVAIEGCSHLCMTKLLERKGYRPTRTIFVLKIATKLGITVEKTRNRAELKPLEKKLVSAVANQVVREANLLIP